MSKDLLEIQIAAAPIRDKIPAGGPLTERLLFAMRYVRKHEDALFWMSANADDDLQFRTALAAVMLAGNDEDRHEITRSLKPLQALSAAANGIPVNFSALDLDVLPLMKMWHESKETK